MPQQKWLFLDFDNTLMGTEHLVLPSLIARFNELYGSQIETPLTLQIFTENFHGLARESLCTAMSDHYGIAIDCPLLYQHREWNVMRHYQSLAGGVAMAGQMLDVLTNLKAQGYKLASVSNSPIQRTLAAMRYASCGNGDRLAGLFGANFFEAGDMQKPKPDVYLRAIEQVGADVASSYAVEDSVSGTTAATGAGLTAFGYTGFSDESAALAAKLKVAGCAATFNDWADFPALLATA